MCCESVCLDRLAENQRTANARSPALRKKPGF
jgi:hypothetical protein